MTPRQINLALWTATALMSAGAAVALVAGTAAPVPNAASGPVAPRVANASHRQRDDIENVDPSDAIWSRPMRDLSSASAAAQPAAATADPNAMPLTLVGTVGRSLALLRTADGVVEVRGVGERLAGAEVVSVEPSR